MIRVLIVEDDPVQREAVGKLLRSQDVETVDYAGWADYGATSFLPWFPL